MSQSRSLKEHVYCPYLGTTVPRDLTSPEHVVPLALGGCDAFSLPVDRGANSTLGSAIDGKLSADFFMVQRRNRFDVRGHSGQRPVPTYKNATIGAMPVQVEIDRFEKALRIYDPRAGRYLNDDETVGTRIEFATQVNIGLYHRFVAKVGLAAGYLAYGSAFVDSVVHADLRSLMNNEFANLDDEAMQLIDVYAADMLRPLTDKLGRWLYLGAQVLGRAVVILAPSSTRFRIAVGCLGEFVGFLSVRSDSARLPNDDDFRWGHVFIVRPDRTLVRGSWASALTLLDRFVTESKAKADAQSDDTDGA